MASSTRFRGLVAAVLTGLTLALPVAPAAGQASGSGGASGAFPPDSVVRDILKQRVREGRSAGIVVGLLDADGSRRIVAWGDPGPGQPALDGSSVFEIGSITKVFTATVLADMVLKGEVSLQDPAQKYLPDDRVTLPIRDGKEITLGSLSEQNSGLPRMPSNFHPADETNPYADYTVDQLYAFLSGYELPRDPGAEFEYSNLGVGLLGHVLALAADTSYEALIRTRIFTPLGMTHTAIHLTPWMKEHLALGHAPGGEVVSNWDVGVLAGAGGIRSTADDMLTFLDANLHSERGSLQEAMAFAQKARAAAGNMRIGLNWIRLAVGADTIVWHNGGTGGYRSFAGMIPSRGVAVVVLTNSGGEGADDIGRHLLLAELPLAPPPAPRTEFTAIELPTDVLERYTGTYQIAPDFAIEVTLEGGGLVTQATGQQKFAIWPYTEHDFFVREFEAQITFVTDEGGGVTGLVLHQNGRDVPGTKVR